MTGRRTTRIAALGTGALLTLGLLGAAPAGAADGAGVDATVGADTTTLVNQTLGLVNQACVDAARAGEVATSALASGTGISMASNTAGTGLNLSVAPPALTGTLPSLGSLPLLGSLAGEVTAEPLQVSCTASADGTTLGLSAAGAEALIGAIAPGVDVSALLRSVDVAASAGLPAGGDLAASAGLPGGDVAASAALPAGRPAASVSATAAAPEPAAAPAPIRSSSASVRVAAADPATAATTATVSPASSSTAPGTLARTGAGVGALGLLGAGLLGAGRAPGLGRKFLRIG